MNTDLLYLTLVCALTGLLWVPYILDRMTVRGLGNAIGYGEPAKPQSAWAQRMLKAHANAVENLVVFAPLVLIAHLLGLTGPWIAGACIVYFWARVVHAIAFTLAIPLVRTVAFFAGFGAQAMIAWQIVNHL